ncbi:MAG: hypothetical protein E2O80_01690 [Betaproteobacteria bacterium]|nr:MAG: hypothetical protein E2O80_01690 [Betaproteobacteria bacterium]
MVDNKGHVTLSLGLLESIREICIALSLGKYNIEVKKKPYFQFSIKIRDLDMNFWVDMLLDNKIIDESKDVEK